MSQEYITKAIEKSTRVGTTGFSKVVSLVREAEKAAEGGRDEAVVEAVRSLCEAVKALAVQAESLSVPREYSGSVTSILAEDSSLLTRSSSKDGE